MIKFFLFWRFFLLLFSAVNSRFSNTIYLNRSLITYFTMQVSGYIHAISHQYIAAMDSYMKATHEPIFAFSFIYDTLRLLANEEYEAFESAVISRIPDLLKLSRHHFV